MIGFTIVILVIMSGCGTVTMYNPGQATPAATARAGIVDPVENLGFDSSGNLYAKIAGGSVAVYAGDLSHRLPAISGSGLILMARTPRGLLWLGKPGALPYPPYLAPRGYAYPTDVAADAGGNVYAYFPAALGEAGEATVTSGRDGSIVEYAASHQVSRILPLTDETSLAVAPDGTLYVAEYRPGGAGGRIIVFPPNSGSAGLTIPARGAFPAEVSVQTDSVGRLYVIELNSFHRHFITVYPPRSNVAVRRIPLDLSPLYMYLAPSGAIAVAGEPDRIELLAPGSNVRQGELFTDNCLGGFDRWSRLFTFQCE